MLRSFLRLKMRGLEIPEEMESMRAPISPSTFLAFANKRAQQTNKTGKSMARFLKLREKLADPSMIFMENNTIANGRSSFKMQKATQQYLELERKANQQLSADTTTKRLQP